MVCVSLIPVDIIEKNFQMGDYVFVAINNSVLGEREIIVDRNLK